MAKQKTPKTKKTVWDTVATEVDTNVWEFKTGPWTWRYDPGLSVPANLFFLHGDEWHAVAFFKNLTEACMYAYGFEGGWLAKERLGKLPT